MELDYGKGLRLYGVYKLDSYKDKTFVLFDLEEYQEYKHVAYFLAFNLDGSFDCRYTLRLPLEGNEIGYSYDYLFDKENHFNITIKEQNNQKPINTIEEKAKAFDLLFNNKINPLFEVAKDLNLTNQMDWCSIIIHKACEKALIYILQKEGKIK